MKIAWVVLLVLAMLLVVVPLPMAGMSGMGWCPACFTGHAGPDLALCLAILASAVLMIALSPSARIRTTDLIFINPLAVFALLRPPRFAVTR